jgi:hypothetical protein
MLPMLLAAVLAVGAGQAGPGTDAADACVRVPCAEECWEVQATYRQITSANNEPLAYVTASVLDGGGWGDQAGAKCHADLLGREGLWIDTLDVPGWGPRKIPAGNVELLLVKERGF